VSIRLSRSFVVIILWTVGLRCEVLLAHLDALLCELHVPLLLREDAFLVSITLVLRTAQWLREAGL